MSVDSAPGATQSADGGPKVADSSQAEPVKSKLSVDAQDAYAGDTAAEQLRAELAASQSEVIRLASELHLATQQLLDLLNSTSWRITAPLRALSSLAGRLKSAAPPHALTGRCSRLSAYQSLATSSETTTTADVESASAPASPPDLDDDTRLIVESGLFDPAWYRSRYPDTENLDPLEHFLRYGLNEGRAASPRFQTAHYVLMHPEVATSGISPILHYLKYGAAEGLETYLPEHIISTVKRTIADAAKVDLDVAADPIFDDVHQLDWVGSIPRTSLAKTWSRLIYSLDGTFGYLVVAPCDAPPEIAQVAIAMTAAAIERHGSREVLLLLTGPTRQGANWPASLPLRKLTELTHGDQVMVVERLIHALAPRAVFNAGSSVCWQVFRRRGVTLSKQSRLFAHLCEQGDPTMLSSTDLLLTLSNLTGLSVASEAAAALVTELGLSPSLRSRIIDLADITGAAVHPFLD